MRKAANLSSLELCLTIYQSQLLYQSTYIFHTPSADSWPQLYRARITPTFYSFPPMGSAYRNNRINWWVGTSITNNLPFTYKAFFWKRCHSIFLSINVQQILWKNLLVGDEFG